MPKQHNYTLREEEVVEIRKAMKSNKARVSKRAHVIYSLHLGYKPADIANLHNVSLATVYNHFNRFKAEGALAYPTNPNQVDRRKRMMNFVTA